MKLIYALLVLFCLSDGSFVLEQSVKTKAQQIEVDDLGALYLIHSNQIEKYFPKSRSFQKEKYDQMNYGQIESVDVSNPMKILVFYRDLQTIVWLDNNLSLHADPMDLSFRYDGNITLAAYSKNNHIWLYNQSEQKLIRCDLELNEVNSSSPLNSFQKGEIEPIALKERDDFVYLMDKTSGLMVFDIFGTFLYKMPLTSNLKGVTWQNQNIIYSDDENLTIHNLKSHKEKEIALPKKNNNQVKFKDNFLYLRNQESIDIYSFQEE